MRPETEKSDYWICIQAPYRKYRITQWYLTSAWGCGKSHMCCSVNVTHNKTENKTQHKTGGGWLHYHKDQNRIQLQKFNASKENWQFIEYYCLTAILLQSLLKILQPRPPMQGIWENFKRELYKVLQQLQLHFRDVSIRLSSTLSSTKVTHLHLLNNSINSCAIYKWNSVITKALFLNFCTQSNFQCTMHTWHFNRE